MEEWVRFTGRVPEPSGRRRSSASAARSPTARQKRLFEDCTDAVGLYPVFALYRVTASIPVSTPGVLARGPVPALSGPGLRFFGRTLRMLRALLPVLSATAVACTVAPAGTARISPAVVPGLVLNSVLERVLGPAGRPHNLLAHERLISIGGH